MIDRKNLKKSLKLNIEWFEKSGVIDPIDGSWGVAERIVLTHNNNALEKTFKAFRAHINYGEYAILEQRRPDCNFETALLFLLASKSFNNKKYYKVVDNILKYLYFRSGSKNVEGVWRWSHDQWIYLIYFDDNAWNSVIALIIANMAPELDSKYHLKNNAIEIATVMEKAFCIQSDFTTTDKTAWKWVGDLKSPHWGSLACMAFAYAYNETSEKKYLDAALSYHKYLLENIDKFSISEYAYILIGSSACSKFMNEKYFTDIARYTADKIIKKIDMSTGNVPSEWSEAPIGKHLVDTIYTQNWVVLGLHMFLDIDNGAKYSKAFEKTMELLLKIQDMSPEKYLRGCWRGMYNMETQSWGGGNCHEGGANSIYTGWTNAPISTVIALELEKQSLLDKIHV